MYKYETHCHTSVGSKCSRVSPREVVEFYKSRGYTGVFITEHFMNGNSTVDRALPWEEQIEQYCKGYEETKKIGDEIGLDVFFGVEYTLRGGNDFLTYGLDKKWWLAHPEVMDMHIRDFCDFARAEGGFVIHAHPFRQAQYIDMIKLIPSNVDGVEIYNSSAACVKESPMAEMYADFYGLLKTAGGDMHYLNREQLSGILTKNRIKSPLDMLKELKEKTVEIFVENI